MRIGPTLVIPGALHRRLVEHVLPGDGAEATAILLCTRVDHGPLKLLAKDMLAVPHATCVRERDRIIWSGDYLEEALDLAEADDLALMLVHSHPGGYCDFSDADDASDHAVMPSLFLARPPARSAKPFHGSAIMLPGGRLRARIYGQDMMCTPVELVGVYGDNLKFNWDEVVASGTRAPRLAFTGAMREELSNLSACVIGVSGTGSLVAEQLARLGFGDIIAVDFDRMEQRNLNRIINSTLVDANTNTLKVEVFARSVASYRPEAIVHQVPTSIAIRDAVLKASTADLLFCCVDSEEGRSLCDRMAAAFLQPLFDVGVTIPIRHLPSGEQAIMDVSGRVDYVQPGGSSLADRGVYTPASLTAEYLAKVDPAAHEAHVDAGYMPGTHEQAPSVITVNMRAASASVGEFIARAYPFRLDSNRLRARTVFSLAACDEEYTSEDDLPCRDSGLLATGAKKPLLGLPNLEPVR